MTSSSASLVTPGYQKLPPELSVFKRDYLLKMSNRHNPQDGNRPGPARHVRKKGLSCASSTGKLLLPYANAISHLHFGVGRNVGLPADGVEAIVCDLLVLVQSVVGPAHLDGVVTQYGGLNAHGWHHGRGVWYWGVWSMEEFVEVNIRVYGVCT